MTMTKLATGIYYYRKRVPKSISSALPEKYAGKGEIWISLKTTDKDKALTRYALANKKVKEMFDNARALLGLATRSSDEYEFMLDTMLGMETTKRVVSVVKEYQEPVEKPEKVVKARNSIKNILDIYIKNNATVTEYAEKMRRSFLLLQQHCGLTEDASASKVTRQHILTFREKLMDFPDVRYVKKEFKQLPFDKMIEFAKENEIPKISKTTLNLTVAYIAAVYAYAAKGEMVDKDPTINLPKIAEKAMTRLPYTDDDIKVMLGSDFFKEPLTPNAYIGLIGIYTGMRENEIIQLLKTDIKKESDIWYIDISTTDENGVLCKKVKTESSVRKVPIPEKVINAGFLDYVDKCQDRNLFKIKVSAFSRVWGTMNDNVGITNKQKVFHCLRHTMKDKLRESRIEAPLADAILGHATLGVGASYGLGYSLVAKKDAIDTVGLTIG